MPTGTRINAPEVQRVIEEANRSAADLASLVPPDLENSPDPRFTLAAGYQQEDGKWATQFEVRELTGRDEEALARIPDVGRTLVAIVRRGVVKLGDDKATEEALDSLMGGDWDTVLLAIRIATFGREVELRPTCTSCGNHYEVTVDLIDNISIRTANREDLSWTVKTKKHTYELSLYTGATQRRIFEQLSDKDKTVPILNTEVLYDSIYQIDGMPVLGQDAIRDLGMSDRKKILASIQEHRVGPDLEGVTIKCPACGNEQRNPLNAAALFQ